MSVLAALQALSATGAFASRAFLPLLLVGAVARWPWLVSWIPFVPDHPVVLSARLAWLSHPWVLLALAALAILEAVAERDPDARQVLQEIDAPIKAIAAFVGAFALVDPETKAILDRVSGPLSAGLSITDGRTILALGFALVVAGTTFVLAWWRSLVFRDARDIADDFGLGRLVAWIEEAWSASSLLLALLAPVLAIILAIVAAAFVKSIQVAMERAAERGRKACPSCGRLALPAASRCPGCAAALTPSSEGAGRLWPDRWLRAGASPRGLELLGRGRCPSCAERRDPQELLAHAPHPCGWPGAHADEDTPARLLASVRARVAPLALAAGLLGILPIAGSVAALVLARARVAAPLRRFLPARARLRARWTVRLLSIPLLLGSGVPVLSAACAAGLVALSGLAWTSAMERSLSPSRRVAAPRSPPA